MTLPPLTVHACPDGSYQLRAGGFIVAEWMARVVAEAIAGMAGENARLALIVKSAARVALLRPHDGGQLDEELEGLLLAAREARDERPWYEKAKERR